MTIKEKLKQYQQDKKAILGTNFYNLETLQAIVQSASEVQVPVILQLTKSSIDYIGLKESVAMARQALADYQLEGWIHLDHGGSVELVQRCLDVGFDSVMIDASEKSFEENIRITSEVVRLAESYQANVEAELGYIAKLGQQQGGEYTTAKEAKEFVEQTGIDALAIAIGSAHGFYKSTPQLNIERLRQIRAATDAVLVLHGSSGIPDEQLKDAIDNGITKINLATEIKNAFMQSLKKVLGNTDEIDLRKVFPEARDSVVALLIDKYNVINDF